MTTPVSTTLNRRYSSPDANATSWEDTVRVLETAELFDAHAKGDPFGATTHRF